MAVIECLYQKGTLPPNTSPATIKQVEDVLARRLLNKMNKSYSWYAACTVAVEAGMWGAKRRIIQRKKLLHLINVCRDARGIAPMVLPEDWASAGIISGYWAYNANVDEHVLRCIQTTLSISTQMHEAGHA